MIKNKKKICFIILTIITLVSILFALNTWQEVLTILIVAVIGLLITQLFDITETTLNKVNDLNKILDSNRYEKTFKIYNDRLLNFAVNFYFFISEMLIDEQKELLRLPQHQDFSLKSVSEAFKNLLSHRQPSFKRVIEDNKETFSSESYNYFNLAQGELCDIYRILQSLPQILEFTANRYPDFINLQSAFYQIKDTFTYNASSRACEAFAETFIKDLSKFLIIK